MNLACNYGAKPDQYKANKYSNYFSGFFLSGIVLPFVLPPSGSLHYCCNNVPTLLFHKMFICITLSWMYVCIVYTINNNIFVSILVQMLEDCPIYFLNIIVNYIYFFLVNYSLVVQYIVRNIYVYGNEDIEMTFQFWFPIAKFSSDQSLVFTFFLYINWTCSVQLISVDQKILNCAKFLRTRADVATCSFMDVKFIGVTFQN